MTPNVGSVDRAARVAIGCVLLILAIGLDTPVRWIGLIGIVPLLTGLLGTCPLYTLLRINTCVERPLRR